MINNPYLLLLLCVFPLYFLIRKRVKFYFRHAYIDTLSGNKACAVVNWQSFIMIGILFLILAASNITWQTKESVKVFKVHRYVLVNDGSGSMVERDKDNGIGKALNSVLSGNNRLFDFLGKRKDGSKDLVGAIVFSDDAFTVSNFSDDPEFVKKKLHRIDYREYPLSSGTDIEAGLWAAVEMLLLDNIDKDELSYLQVRFYGEGYELKVDDKLQSIVNKKNNVVGSSIIIFTDGIFNAYGNQKKMSSHKIINFCKLVGIRVYFISLFALDSKISEFCKATGGRGEIVSGYDQKRLEEIYDDIAKSQAKEYSFKEMSVDHSLSDIFGLIGLALIVLGLVLHVTLQRNFTEV